MKQFLIGDVAAGDGELEYESIDREHATLAVPPADEYVTEYPVKCSLQDITGVNTDLEVLAE